MSVKAGTAPEVLRLPKGGGAITAISEGFTPDLKSGTGNYRIPIEVPEGRVPLPVQLELSYSTGFGNGPFGLGWELSGVPVLQRRLDLGIPTYTDSDRLELSTVGELARVGDGRYRALVEGAFSTLERDGESFALRDRDGRLFRFGETAAARIADPNDPQRVFRWLVSSIEDLNGNRTEFDYRRDDTPRDHLAGPANQLYLSHIRYNNLPGGGFLYHVNVEYDFHGPGQQRPDPVLSYRAGFALETNWRARAIKVKLGQDSAEAHAFDTLPDGTPVTAFRPVQPNSFEPWGFLVNPMAPLSWNNLGLFPAGSVLGADTPVLGLASGQALTVGEVEFMFLVAFPKRVTLSFYGADATYTLRAYDELNGLVAQTQVDAPLFGGAQTISVEPPDASIFRVEFGNPAAAFGIAGIELLYQAAPLCRRYQLAYGDTGPARLSLLRTVQLFGENPDGSLISRPPITFGYSVSDEANRVLRPIAGAPSVSLGRDEWEVVDLTGTVTPDIFYTAGANDHKYYLNRGAATVAARADMPTAPAVTLADLHARLGDIKGLVAADLFTKDHVYPNPSIKPGRALSDPVEWGAQETMTGFPAFAAAQLPEVRFLDLTGDGRVDILRTAERFYMWFQQPDHTFVAQPPLDRVASYLEEAWPNVTFADSRIKLADMTGDGGFMDIVRVDDLTARVEYWPNKGLGQWGRKRMMFFDGTGLTYPLSVERMFFDDIDGNGFADLIYIDSGRLFIWPNQGGRTFGPQQRIDNTPLVGSGELDAVRLVDMTGCGTLGPLWTRDGAATEQTFQFMNLTGEVKPQLLTRVENGTGGVTEVQYASSAVLYHADERAGLGWEATVPFALHVVTKITRTDTTTAVQEETTYAYRDGYYDREKRQFRGFGKVTVAYSGDATLTREVRGAFEVHHFHQHRVEGLTEAQKAQARALAGRQYLIEYFDQDGTTLLKWTRTDWRVVPVYRWERGAPAAAETDQDGTPVLFPYIYGLLEGTEEGTPELKMKYEREFRSVPNPQAADPAEIAASHGQVVERRLYGEVALRPPGDLVSATLTTVRRDGVDTDVIDVPGDTRLITRSYAINEAANLERIASEITRDAANTIVAERHYFYDGGSYQGLAAGQVERGNLSRRTDLVLRQHQLATLYAGSAYNPDWAALGYEMQPLADGSANGLYIHSQRFRYGDFGTPAGILSPLGQETNLFYDDYKTRLVKTLNPLGHALTATYEYRVGMQRTYTDENGQRWEWVYDGFGRLTKEIEPGDTEALPTRTYVYRDYDAVSLGRPIAIIKHERETQGEESVFSTYQYLDGFLQDLQTRKPWRTERWALALVRKFRSVSWLGWLRRLLLERATYYQVTSRAYNARGGVALDTLPYINAGYGYQPPSATIAARRFAYDALLRNTKVTNPDDTERQVQRAPWVKTAFDEEDTTAGSPHHDTPSSFYLNTEESIVKVDRRLGNRTISYQFEYDVLSNLVKATDPAANVIRWSFDTRGLLIRLVHPDAGTILHYFNAAGREVARTYSNGDLIEFTYDELSRLKTKKFAGAAPRTETFIYDVGEGTNLIGRLAEVHDAAGTLALGYDTRGREVWQKRTFTSEPGTSYITQLTYDPMGRLRSVVYPDAAVTNYRYGFNGKVEQVDGLIIRVLYDQSGRASRMYYAGGARQVIIHEPTTHRVSRQVLTAGRVSHHDFVYTYDKVGNITTITDNSPAQGHVAMSRDYVYDDLYRLKSFTSQQGHNEFYDYDDIGNIIRHTGYSANSLVYPGVGQTSTLLGAQGETAWQYDANGKLTEGAGFDEMRWDAAQNLIRAVEPDGTTHQFRYSHEGNLVERVRTPPRAASESIRTLNKHFSAHPNHTLRRIYVHDMLAAFVRRVASDDFSFFTITNEVDSVIGTVDQTGAYNQVEYEPYGTRLYQTVPDVQYGFSAKEEVAPDLLAFDFRFLFTPAGRWIQPDPLILATNENVPSRPERLNVYAYAGNNPINRIDPFGLADIAKTSSSGKREEQPPTATDVAVGMAEYTLTHASKHVAEEASKSIGEAAGARLPGAAATVGAAAITIVKGAVVFAEVMVLFTRDLREKADAAAELLRFKPVQGTNKYISPSKGQLIEINPHRRSPIYGTLIPVEGKLKVIWPGSVYYHSESKTMYWQSEQGNQWLSYTSESEKRD